MQAGRLKRALSSAGRSAAVAPGVRQRTRDLEHLNGDCVSPALSDLSAALLWFLF